MRWSLAKSISTLRKFSIGLTVGLLGCLIAFTPLGMRWEENLGLAWLFKLRGPIDPPTQVVVVNMDAKSAVALGQPPKIRDWQRELHAQLIDRLVTLGANVIVFDVFFEANRDGDIKLAAAMERAERVVLAQYLQHERIGHVVAQKVSNPAATLAMSASGLAPFPLPEVPHRVNQFWSFLTENVPTLPFTALQVYVIQVLGYEKFKAMLKLAGIQSPLPASIADANDLHKLITNLHKELQTNEIYTKRLISIADNHTNLSHRLRKSLISLVNAYGAPRSQYINFYGPSKTIETVRYDELLGIENQYNKSMIGKAVFVGSLDPSPFDEDEFHTVFSKSDGTDLSGVEISATVLANLLNSDTLRYPASLHTSALLLFFGILTGSAAYLLRGIWTALTVSFGIGVCYVVAAQLLFNYSFLWLPVFVPALIQLPLALATGLMLQYLETRKEGDNLGRVLRYQVPEHAAQILTASSNPLTPERAYGTCLLSDVADYTTLSEQLPAEELALLSNEYFADIGAHVRNHGGERLDIAGDGLTCVWPTPHEKEQKQLLACLAALDILQAVDKFNARHPDFPFHTRIGLDSGWLAMGHMGGSGHFTYGIAGDIVNTASRIEGLNKYLGTKLLASNAVVKGLEEILLLRPVGCFQLKGKKNILEISEIICPHDRATVYDRMRCEEFSEALCLFSDQQWSNCSKSLNTLSKRYPDDGPTGFYKERCEQILINSFASGVGSVIRLEDK